MTPDSKLYLSNLHQLIDRHFDLEEIHALCFQLGVDYDSIRGEGKSARIRHLILALGRNGRLSELLTLAMTERPCIAWPPIPADLEPPGTLEPGEYFTPMTPHHSVGDVIQGHKTDGDHIQVGNILGSNIAIGRSAIVTIHSGDPFNVSGDFRGANLTIKSILQNASQAIALYPPDESARVKLQRLLVQLNELLQAVPSNQATAAEELAESTKLLIEVAAAEKPNPTSIRMMGAGLKEVTYKLKDELPAAIDIVMRIITTVTALAT